MQANRVYSTVAGMNLGGKFIVIDGPEGAGKGTQVARLEAAVRQAGGDPVRAKDPGGTPIGERIRHLLLDYDLGEMDPVCETLLFMASRSQLAAQVIRPALAAGRTVLGDRFISATCAYQVAAGFPREQVIELGRIAVGDTWPDLTIVLDVPPEVGLARTARHAPHPSDRRRAKGPGGIPSGPGAAPGEIRMFADAGSDAMERRPMEFHRRVRELFRELPAHYPRPVVVVDGTRSPDEVFRDVMEALARAFR